MKQDPPVIDKNGHESMSVSIKKSNAKTPPTQIQVKNSEDPSRAVKFYDDYIDFRGDILRRPPNSKNCRILWEYLYLLLQDDNYTIIDAGTEVFKGVNVRVAKLLPQNDEDDIVLSTLYIDPTNRVILKSKTTTRENGSFELEMNYGKYINMALPDKINFTFHTKDYKLPKGLTFDFDDGKKASGVKKNPTKGMAEITIKSYKLNKGVSDQIFK
jgi:hypothetical protein